MKGTKPTPFNSTGFLLLQLPPVLCEPPLTFLFSLFGTFSILSSACAHLYQEKVHSILTHLLAQQILPPRVVRTELGDSQDIRCPKRDWARLWTVPKPESRKQVPVSLQVQLSAMDSACDGGRRKQREGRRGERMQ